MQRIAASIYGHMIFCATQLKRSLSNSVSISAHHRTEEVLWIGEILRGIVVAKHNICHSTLPIWRFQADDSRTEIRQNHP
jgi:hypothetical protein